MALPSIDFSSIAETAKQALVAYGTKIDFREEGGAWRKVSAVIYRDGSTGINGTFPMIGDADSIDAVAILNPDEYQTPYRVPRKFDQLKIDVSGFTRTYSIESVSPILAADTLPLLMVHLRSN